MKKIMLTSLLIGMMSKAILSYAGPIRLRPAKKYKRLAYA